MPLEDTAYSEKVGNHALSNSIIVSYQFQNLLSTMFASFVTCPALLHSTHLLGNTQAILLHTCCFQNRQKSQKIHGSTYKAILFGKQESYLVIECYLRRKRKFITTYSFFLRGINTTLCGTRESFSSRHTIVLSMHGLHTTERSLFYSLAPRLAISKEEKKSLHGKTGGVETVDFHNMSQSM